MDWLSNLWCRIFIFHRGLRFLKLETYSTYMTLHSSNALPEVLGESANFVKPRTEHSWIGFPSVCISAVVAKDHVIMWDEVPGRWNGQKAADMYSGPMLKALKRTWGAKRSYTIIEDGDRKGNQSNKGKAAKVKSKINAITLPPRSPCWMPLDYAIWSK